MFQIYFSANSIFLKLGLEGGEFTFANCKSNYNYIIGFGKKLNSISHVGKISGEHSRTPNLCSICPCMYIGIVFYFLQDKEKRRCMPENIFVDNIKVSANVLQEMMVGIQYMSDFNNNFFPSHFTDETHLYRKSCLD